MPSINVNGRIYEIEIDPQTPLLWYLRDHLGLMGAKYSCGIAECGACTVHVDGEAVLSCVTPLEDVFGMHVTTIEGLAGNVADPFSMPGPRKTCRSAAIASPGRS